MHFYEHELRALKRANRFRERICRDDTEVDLASNDYLALAHSKPLLEATCKILSSYRTHAPKASMLVNGYHPIHRAFEKALCEANGFEEGLILGSGFSANLALIEALARRGDTLFIDEKFHASGMLATRVIEANTVRFEHNCAEHLETLLKASTATRNIVVVEGVYSMQGDLLNREIIDIANHYGAILIVDEAHSSGVVGARLMGIFDLYGITVASNHIKMGTLGKAYGSFGGYILASHHIITYLINRAKPVIYATALSLFDTLLGHQALQYILSHAQILNEEIDRRRRIVCEYLGVEMPALIAAVPIGSNTEALHIKEALQREGITVGAIRPPTVDTAIIRLIARLGESDERLQFTCKFINNFQVK